jgi:hypothetical protein
MNRLALLLIVGLAGCSSSPPPATTTAAVDDCVARASPVGSMIIKREACVPVSDDARAEARRRAEEMQAQQERSRRNSAGPSGR